jgi:hypothetical protein
MQTGFIALVLIHGLDYKQGQKGANLKNGYLFVNWYPPVFPMRNGPVAHALRAVAGHPIPLPDTARPVCKSVGGLDGLPITLHNDN